MTDKPSAKDVLAAWMDAVNGGRVEEVCSLYAPSAILLPTFSSRTLRSDEERRRYFEQLATREDLSVTLHQKSVHCQSAASVELISGIYCFHFRVDEEILAFEARFSFAVNLSERAPILHHHSSQVPRQLS